MKTGRTAILTTLSVCLIFGLASLPSIRDFLGAPLIVTDGQARGDAAYVLAGGNAIRERLFAAADLCHLGQVQQILLKRDDSAASYSFRAKESWTATRWHLHYLASLGVPEQAITIVDMQAEGFLGTLQEARTIAAVLPDSVHNLVIVTSPQHTRRSLLAFRRSLNPAIQVSAYAACGYRNSIEFYHPLWLEYLKLVVYWLIA